MTSEKCLFVLNKILEYSLYGLAFFIPISLAMTNILTVTAIVAFFLQKILIFKASPAQGAGSRPFLDRATFFLLLLFFFSALSLVNGEGYLLKGLRALFGKWGKFMMLSFVAAQVLDGEARLRKISLVFLASAGLVVLDAYSQKFLGLEFLLHRPLVDVSYAEHIVPSITGAFQHPNDLAAYLIAMIPLLSGLATTRTKPCGSSRSFLDTCYGASLLGVTLLLVLSLILTFSRGGWLGFIAAGGLLFFLFPQKKFLLVLASLFSCLLLFSPGVVERALSSLQSGGDSGRYELWGGTWAMIADHPFLGRGIGLFMDFFQDYVQGRGAMYAHNCYLQMWAEIGIFGLLSFLAFVGTVLWQGFAALRRPANDGSRAILAGLLCAVIAFLVQCFFDTHLYSVQPSALFWLLIGLTRAQSRAPQSRPAPSADKL